MVGSLQIMEFSMRLTALLSPLLALAFVPLSQAATPDVLCEAAGSQCTFVLLEGSEQRITAINPERAARRLPPFSTFKIPNSIIALDSGVLTSESQPLVWDSKKHPRESWWRKNWTEEQHDLVSAFKYSAVPLYQNLALLIGGQRMQQYVTDFNYGNMDISSGLDTFWLGGSLAISANEQVRFLQQYQLQRLPVSDATRAKMKRVMLVDEGKDYKLYAKTGAGSLGKDKRLGWYVGIVERGDTSYFFATNITGKRFKDVTQPRKDIAHYYLKQFGVLPN